MLGKIAACTAVRAGFFARVAASIPDPPGVKSAGSRRLPQATVWSVRRRRRLERKANPTARAECGRHDGESPQLIVNTRCLRPPKWCRFEEPRDRARVATLRGYCSWSSLMRAACSFFDRRNLDGRPTAHDLSRAETETVSPWRFPTPLQADASPMSGPAMAEHAEVT